MRKNKEVIVAMTLDAAAARYAELYHQIAAMEDELKKVRAAIIEMVPAGTAQTTGNGFKISHTVFSETRFDGVRFKKENPGIAATYQVTSERTKLTVS